jgi:hypothetical protein
MTGIAPWFTREAEEGWCELRTRARWQRILRGSEQGPLDHALGFLAALADHLVERRLRPGIPDGQVLAWRANGFPVRFVLESLSPLCGRIEIGSWRWETEVAGLPGAELRRWERRGGPGQPAILGGRLSGLDPDRAFDEIDDAHARLLKLAQQLAMSGRWATEGNPRDGALAALDTFETCPHPPLVGHHRHALPDKECRDPECLQAADALIEALEDRLARRGWRPMTYRHHITLYHGDSHVRIEVSPFQPDWVQVEFPWIWFARDRRQLARGLAVAMRIEEELTGVEFHRASDHVAVNVLLRLHRDDAVEWAEGALELLDEARRRLLERAPR